MSVCAFFILDYRFHFFNSKSRVDVNKGEINNTALIKKKVLGYKCYMI